MLKTFNTRFPVRLSDYTSWKWSLTENSAGDAISVGHCGIFAELPISTLKIICFLYKNNGMENKFGTKAVATFENLIFSEQTEMF